MPQNKEFDLLDPVPARRRVYILRSNPGELARIYPRASEAFAQHLASLAICESIRRHHEDNFWSIFDQRQHRLRGIYAMAMLTEDGLTALLSGTFEPQSPRLAHVTETGGSVAAIYKWGVYAPGVAAAAIPLIADHLAARAYSRADLYGNGSTPGGRRIMSSLGFRPVGDPRTPSLFRYRRLANRPAPARVPSARV